MSSRARRDHGQIENSAEVSGEWPPKLIGGRGPNLPRPPLDFSAWLAEETCRSQAEETMPTWRCSSNCSDDCEHYFEYDIGSSDPFWKLNDRERDQKCAELFARIQKCRWRRAFMKAGVLLSLGCGSTVKAGVLSQHKASCTHCRSIRPRAPTGLGAAPTAGAAFT